MGPRLRPRLEFLTETEFLVHLVSDGIEGEQQVLASMFLITQIVYLKFGSHKRKIITKV